MTKISDSLRPSRQALSKARLNVENIAFFKEWALKFRISRVGTHIFWSDRVYSSLRCFSPTRNHLIVVFLPARICITINDYCRQISTTKRAIYVFYSSNMMRRSAYFLFACKYTADKDDDRTDE